MFFPSLSIISNLFFIFENSIIEYINNIPLLYFFSLEILQLIPINFCLFNNKIGEPAKSPFVLQLWIRFELFISNKLPYDTNISLSLE